MCFPIRILYCLNYFLLSRFLSQTNKPDKADEDDATTTKNSTPIQDANTKPQAPATTSSDSNQGSEGAEPVPSTSPSVSQHQPVYQLPFLHVMYTQFPNMTNHPRMPQGISVESDGSDLPDGKFPAFPCFTAQIITTAFLSHKTRVVQSCFLRFCFVCFFVIERQRSRIF